MADTILIADDDAQIREVIDIALARAGFATAHATNGAEALAHATATPPALLILDIGMPELDGLEVCRRLRRTSDLPVLFLSAHDGEIDRVLGLELGADDYVTKPFSPRELVARVRTILKRTNPPQTPPEPQGWLRRGGLDLNSDMRLCRFGTNAITLTDAEFRLLALLMRRPDQVLSRPQVTDALYHGNANANDRTTDSHLRNLRAKLARAGCADAVETLHGMGIRMGPCKGA